MITIEWTSVIITGYYLFGSLFALTLAVAQIVPQNRKPVNVVLCLFFICNSIWLMDEGIYSLLVLAGQAILANIFALVSVIAGALLCGFLFLFLRSVLAEPFQLRRQDLRHFIIPILIILYAFTKTIVHFDKIGSGSFYEAFLVPIWYFIDTVYLVYLSYFSYEIVSILLSKQTENKKLVAIVLLIVLLSILGIFTTLFFVSLIPLVLVFIYIVGHRYPQILKTFETERTRSRYLRSQIRGIALDEIVNRLDRLMVEEKLFTQEDITVKTVADLLQIRQHQLSEIVNDKFGKSFTTYINTYRIEEAKRLLIESPELSVLEVGYESGFNSSSSFYRYFKQVLGIAPGTYRKHYSQ